MPTNNILFRPMSRADIEADAIDLINRFQPEVLKGQSFFDVEDFAEFDLEDITGVQFDVTDQLPPEIYGLTDPIQSKLWIHADIANDPFSQKFLRSTLAHEVGHCIYHVPLIQQSGKIQVFKQGKGESETALCRKRDIKPYLNPEWQAWNFAGALLMPKPLLRTMVNDGMSIRALSDHFQVNGAFVRKRLEILKLVKK